MQRGLATGALVAIGLLACGWWGMNSIGSERFGEGINSRTRPITVDPGYLSRVVLGKVHPVKEHPFFGRRILIVDLRSAEEFFLGHFPYSTNWPESAEASEGVSSGLADPDCVAILYGGTESRRKSLSAVRPDRIFVLDSGWDACLEKLPERPNMAEKEEAMMNNALQLLPGMLHTRKEEVRERAKRMGLPFVDVKPPPTLTVEELKAKLDRNEDVLVLFVGTEDKFRERRIRGARRVALPDIGMFMSKVAKDREVVFYCGCCTGQSLGLSGYAAMRCQEDGFSRASNLVGHLQAWVEAGYPTEP